MRILALDLGARRIGVAISDSTGTIAQGLEVIDRQAGGNVLTQIRRRVAANLVERIVVGLPLRMDGTEGVEAEKVRRFVNRLREVVGVPVDVQDERLSSAEADRIMIAADVSRARRRRRRDAVAAALILQTYLDRRR